MKIGLISDTHIPEAMPELPQQVRTVFAGVDLILHAGDLHCLAVLDWLEEIAPVLACRGNGDDGSGGRPLVPEDPRLREAVVTGAAGYTIGLVHDVLDPEEFPHWPLERTMEVYFGRHVDLIVCGHTHVESVKPSGDVLVINPGSPTFPHNYSAQPGTVAVVTLAEHRRGGTVTVYDLKTLRGLPGLSVRF
ncbi:MAG: metallophosphatase family protein [Candidatus Binatia bacterium]|nr:metallophosphatase family protein [Candidatus Binatia bacterium]